METILIIDSNNLAYSSFYAFKDLSYQEKKTGVIFGFIQKVISLAKKFETKNFIFCWDSKKSYRKLIYPEYKANRRKDLTEQEKADLQLAFEQFTELRTKTLLEMGFNNNLMQTGYEADDLIAKIVIENCNQSFWIASTDQDMYQLLDKAAMYNHKTKKKTLYKDIVSKYSATPSLWAEVKAVAGCDSDNVKGIKGVGEMTAIKYLQDRLLEGKIKDRIESKEGQRIIERNRQLVYLPFQGRKKLNTKLKEDSLKKDKFIEVFMRYGFESLLKKEAVENWAKPFNL